MLLHTFNLKFRGAFSGSVMFTDWDLLYFLRRYWKKEWNQPLFFVFLVLYKLKKQNIKVFFLYIWIYLQNKSFSSVPYMQFMLACNIILSCQHARFKLAESISHRKFRELIHTQIAYVTLHFHFQLLLLYPKVKKVDSIRSE